MRAAILSGLLIATAALAAGCSSREDAWTSLWRSEARWYGVAWGAPPELTAAGAARARFDCIWDGLKEAGQDPTADLACWTRRMDLQADCMSGLSPQDGDRTFGAALADCISRSEALCPVSALYVEMAAKCRPLTPGRL